MKTFKIKIGQYTAKNKYIELHKFIVNSENNREELLSAYIKNYQGFSVYIEEVQEVKVIKKIDKEKEAEELAITTVTPNKSIYSDTIKSYDAVISSEDIVDLWEKREKELEPLINKIKNIEESFEFKVRDKFNLKLINNFRIISGGVKFNFSPDSFKFESKENKAIK